MRSVRRLFLVAIPVLVASLMPGSVSSAVDSRKLEPVFAEAVYGDFALAGNTVLSCPPVQACTEARQRKGSGVTAMNNGHSMVWADVDADESTFNSSSARLAVPPGADVAYAKLDWAGNAGSRPELPCGDPKTSPPGTPDRQAVSLAVNSKAAARIGPDRFVFTLDDPDSLSTTDQQFYSASADVTKEFAGVHGDATVTVGDVWTPRGPDCFGGWSLTLAWKFAGPTAKYAPARRFVTVYNGHVRVPTSVTRAQVIANAPHSAGGTARVGITAYEGDWATPGDNFLINGIAQGGAEAGNFFSSFADGALKPSDPNNMSVDVRTVSVSDEVVPPGVPSAELVFTRRDDAYLVRNVVASFPLPELTVTTSPDRPAAHAGDPVVQTVTVANPGGAPAHDVTVRIGAEPACERKIGGLAAAATKTVTCELVAQEDDYKSVAKASGRSLVDDALAAEATAGVEVLRPAVRVTHSAAPTTVLQGQPVRLTTVVTNSGDTPLSGLSLHNSKVGTCDRTDAGSLAPGAEVTIECAATAAEDGGTNTVTATAGDALGRQVSATGDSAFDVIHPLMTLTTAWSADRAERGDLVTITVRVGNPSQVPFADVEVTGEPASCHRSLGTLAAGQRISYTCEVVIAGRIDSELTVSGSPVVDGVAVGEGASASAAVRIGMLPDELIVTAPSPEQPRPAVAKAAQTRPLSKPAVGGLAAVVAAASMFVVAGAITGVRSR